MKYINLETASKETLAEMHKNHPKPQLRERAQILLLSNKGTSVIEITNLLEIDRQRVIRCFNRWDEKGLGGLYDQSGRGRKPIFTEAEEKEVVKIVESSPKKLEGSLPEIEQKTGKRGSKSTIKRILRKSKYAWCRIRKSLKSKRDEADFRAGQEELNSLKELENKGLIDLFYFDESGFSLVPYIPYAWQKKGQPIEVPCARSTTLNVLGFMNRSNSLTPYCFTGSINSSIVIACIDNFYNQRQAQIEQQGLAAKVTYLIIDNAPIHTSKEFRANELRWEAQGLRIKRLPAYSPELNLIEILWRKMKYEWIGFDAYQSYKQLVEWVDEMLIGFGQKYIINFG